MKMEWLKTQETVIGLPGTEVYREMKRGFTLFKSIENGLVHCSISHPKRWPTWDELKFIRYNFMRECRYVAQILPPENEFVNIHNNCFHLYELDPKELRR